MLALMSRPRRRALVMPLVAVAALVLAGCGGGSDGDTAHPSADAPAAGGSSSAGEIPAQQTDDKIAALVPQKYRDAGSIEVVTDAGYPPTGFFDEDGKTIIGLDPDLGKALGEVMGVDFKFTAGSFDGIVPGLQSGQYQLAMSGINDTEERRKVIDFVDTYKGGSQFFMAKGTSPEISGIEDLCGRTVAVQKGSVQAEDVAAQDEKCRAAGDKAIEVSVYPDQTACNLALTTGRAEFSAADTPVAAYQVLQSDGALDLAGEEYGSVLHGIGVPKDSGLVEPLQKAMGVLIGNGAYQQILEKWNLGQTAIDEPMVNNEPVAG
jgi:polar amino acid transport system substrate-binding protein